MTTDVFHRRPSVPSRQLGEPGPDDDALQRLLAMAVRAPDHGKLVPWRLVVIRGDARRRLGDALAAIHLGNEPDLPQALIDKDRERFNHAPLVVAVVARIEDDHPKVPRQEQLLSAGCVAYNLVLGAQSLGFDAQWLTGWAAYDADAARLFGLAANESIVAFVHIGTAREAVPERQRPRLDDIVSEFEIGAP